MRTSVGSLWLSLALISCGPDSRPEPDPGNPECTDPAACPPGECVPGVNLCVGNDVVACNPDGTIGQPVTSCGSDTCSGGQCQTPCVVAANNRSYVGCEFWPV